MKLLKPGKNYDVDFLYRYVAARGLGLGEFSAI